MSISRRQFCATVGAAGVVLAARPAFADIKAEKPLRVIAYNILACTGWPSDRPLAKKAVAKGQMANRLAMELALYEGDIVNFSESPREEITKEVASLLDMHHSRFPGGSFPGTLLSRFEITDAKDTPLGKPRPKELFTRHWGRATLKLPDGEPIIVHSAHLHPTAEPKTRLAEIRAMLETMKADLDDGGSMLLIGDLNHSPGTEEHKLWTDAGWIDTFEKVGKGEGLTIPADKPRSRIDYVMAAGPIAKKIVESRPLFEGAFRVNLADENSFALSDHVPQFAMFDLAK
jgi:endonuclease/exonuclease/phosphatase family metal-dependent hydrolase